MSKRVLITGAGGFVGRVLMELLANGDYEVYPSLRRKRGLKNEIVVDFCDPDFCSVVNNFPEVDAVVHLGARIGWDRDLKNALFKPNVLATAELADWAKRIGAQFVFASTAIVCGVKNSLITSESIPKPDTDYGYSKWLAEEMIQMSGVKSTILRISGIFGIDGPSHLGINKAIAGALNGIVPVQYGSGNIKRNYIYIKDLVNIIKYCVENKITGTHLVAGSSVNTVSEMLKIICDVLLPGKKPEYVEGEEGKDQIIEHSAYLPKNRAFKEAIKDIKRYA